MTVTELRKALKSKGNVVIRLGLVVDEPPAPRMTTSLLTPSPASTANWLKAGLLESREP